MDSPAPSLDSSLSTLIDGIFSDSTLKTNQMIKHWNDSDVVICRACINDCMEYKNIHRQGIIMGELTTLAHLLAYCTNLDFPEHEHFLPANMCTRCIQNLAKLYAFKQTVIKANETLRNQHTELIGDSDSEEFQATTPSNEVQQKQEDDHAYVTLTVLEENKLQSHSMHISNQEIENIEDSKHSDELLDEQQVNEMHHDGEQNEIYEVEEELESEEPFKVEDEEEFIVTIHESEQSATASSVCASEVEEDVQHAVVNTTKRTAENTTAFTDFLEQKRFRAVKPRIKNHGRKPANPDLQCQVCGKQLSNSNSFRYHMQLHSDTTPFLCSLCGEGFKTRNAYEGHMSLHDPNNPNTCEICGKTYRQPSSLRAHMFTHTGEKPFQCDICGKGMTQKSGYKKHMLTHTGEKPHSCDICGRAFRYSSNLISHRRHHTGEKPYDCPLCEKSFSTTEQLKRHTLVHTGEKPFNCDVCNKRFNRRSSLVTHRHIHDANRETGKNRSITKAIS